MLTNIPVETLPPELRAEIANHPDWGDSDVCAALNHCKSPELRAEFSLEGFVAFCRAAAAGRVKNIGVPRHAR